MGVFRRDAVGHEGRRPARLDVEPQAGLLIYERGDSGLFRALRLYDDVDGM
ncbi:MAG TPA: hypothetical protein VMI53_12205 [Opitutaceae bacterium]|nr:hypothetical protein [Opitutaceae bacterium]